MSGMITPPSGFVVVDDESSPNSFPDDTTFRLTYFPQLLAITATLLSSPTNAIGAWFELGPFAFLFANPTFAPFNEVESPSCKGSALRFDVIREISIWCRQITAQANAQRTVPEQPFDFNFVLFLAGIFGNGLLIEFGA